MPIIARPFALVTASLCLLGLAACGDDDDSSDAATETTVADTTSSTETTETTAATDAEDAATTVTTADSALGTILVDADGNTLYAFLPDAQGPSTCVDMCAANWPALLGPAEAGDGVDATLLGTAERTDGGGTQVTYNGWSLYHFAPDAAPGDTNGQGVGGNWYVVGPDGNPIEG